MSNEEVRRHSDQPPLMHIIRLKFFSHIARADPSMDHSRALRSSVVPYGGTGTTDQADLVKLGSAQLNLMLLHSALVWQLPVIEHKIGRHGGRLWKWQCLLDKPHDDYDDVNSRPKCGLKSLSVINHASKIINGDLSQLIILSKMVFMNL